MGDQATGSVSIPIKYGFAKILFFSNFPKICFLTFKLECNLLLNIEANNIAKYKKGMIKTLYKNLINILS